MLCMVEAQLMGLALVVWVALAVVLDVQWKRQAQRVWVAQEDEYPPSPSIVDGYFILAIALVLRCPQRTVRSVRCHQLWCLFPHLHRTVSILPALIWFPVHHIHIGAIVHPVGCSLPQQCTLP